MLYVNRIFDLYREHSWQCVSVFFVVYAIILLGGAAIFKYIEEPAEISSHEALKVARLQFMQKVRNCNASVTEKDVDNYARTVLYHGFQKVTLFDGNPSASNWGIGQAVFFSGSIITTLGYAQTTYLTDTGKMFAVFFICLGVPLTLFFFSACVHRINRLFLWQKSWMAFHFTSLSPLQVKLLHFSGVSLVLWMTLLMLPALIFTLLEGWTYTDAFFFCFMSMTTVGMVDDLPGDQHYQAHRTIYKLSLLLYMYMGLITVLAALELFSEIPLQHDDSSEDQYEPKPLKEEEASVAESIPKGKNYSTMETLNQSSESSD